jgi:DNA-binding transcriptional LysR family regulator
LGQRSAGSLHVNSDLLRSFFAISELGSLSKAAERLRVSQSTLTRQMQTLEHEIGGRLLERGHSGVALTSAGQTLLEGMRPILAQTDVVINAARKLARGQSGSLRIGYLMSAAAEYLNPALAIVRKAHPEIKVKLIDMSPGEQIAAMRRGELDLAVVGHADATLPREFFVKRIASLPLVVALPETHPLASSDSIALSDLKREVFIGAQEADLPAYNRWIVQLCRAAGFRPRFVEYAESLTHSLSLLVTENAVTLLPSMVERLGVPGVVFRPLEQVKATWDLLIAWPRGKITDPVRALVDALSTKLSQRFVAEVNANAKTPAAGKLPRLPAKTKR